jgi:hypothetical protein
VPVHDLAIHEEDLVLATHGRSFWILDDISPLRQSSDASRTAAVWLYDPAQCVAGALRSCAQGSAYLRPESTGRSRRLFRREGEAQNGQF